MLNKGINNLLVEGAIKLVNEGTERSNKRTGSKIIELRDHVMKGNPEMRYINIDSRKNNICAQIVEMMMVLSGNPDLKYLSLFLPRAVDYSDDEGKTWRGNYGIRLRGNKVFEGEYNNSFQFAKYTRDNLKRVIEDLTDDPSSRQSFITIGDSNLDRFIKTKDTPCTMTLVFGITENNLVTLSTFMRSNDIIFGFSGVNYFIFTCLQELVASILGYDLGEYCHHSVSFHVYDYKFDLINKISNENLENISEVKFNKGLFRGFKSLEEFDKLSKTYFKLLNDIVITRECETPQLFWIKKKLSEVCPNENLLVMLCATFAYIIEYKLSDFNACMFGTDVEKSGLFKRDPFFNKHVK